MLPGVGVGAARSLRYDPFHIMTNRILCLFSLALLFSDHAPAASPEQDLSDLLRWRNIGPHRGGRVRAIAGVPSQPNVFYFAQVNGGVFKTNDYGRTWQPNPRKICAVMRPIFPVPKMPAVLP